VRHVALVLAFYAALGGALLYWIVSAMRGPRA
jgi:hypothetical protein